MGCPEWNVAAFVARELSSDEERMFDEHLLACEECWVAVREDRLGRAAAVRLRTAAPSGLEDQVRFAIAVESRQPILERRPVRARRIRWGLLVSVTAAVAASMCLLVSGGPTANPPQVTALMAMVTPGAPSSALRAGEHLDIAGQTMSVRAYLVHGHVVIAATSHDAFAMPSRSHLLPGSSEQAWMASSGSISLYGVNHAATGLQSMLILAKMPMAELPGIAAQLKLI